MKNPGMIGVLSSLYILVSLASCGLTDLNKKADASGDQFYAFLAAHQFDSAVSLCSNKAFERTPREAWIQLLERNSILLGDITHSSRIKGFNFKRTKEGNTTVTIGYNVDWQYGESTDTLIFIKDDSGELKIFGYKWLPRHARYVDEVAVSHEEAGAYMQAIKENKLDTALNRVDEEAFRLTSREAWRKLLQEKAAAGTLTNYTVVKDSTVYHIGATGSLGKGNYYDVLVLTTRGERIGQEKLVLFQRKYYDPVKVMGHNFYTQQ